MTSGKIVRTCIHSTSDAVERKPHPGDKLVESLHDGRNILLRPLLRRGLYVHQHQQYDWIDELRDEVTWYGATEDSFGHDCQGSSQETGSVKLLGVKKVTAFASRPKKPWLKKCAESTTLGTVVDTTSSVENVG